MAFLIPLAVFVALFLLVSWRMRPTNGLGGGRVLARGLVLSASPYSAGERTQFGRRFELRNLVLDVEIPGREPYEVSLTPLIPRICEGRPGAALDLSVNPRRPNDITILGPAGSSAWLGAAPQLTGQAGPGSRAGRYLAATFLAIIPSFVVLGVVVQQHNRSSHGGTPERSASQHALSASCEQAAKCCRVLGTSACTQFARMDDTACVRAFQTEVTAAAKAHKRCP